MEAGAGRIVQHGIGLPFPPQSVALRDVSQQRAFVSEGCAPADGTTPAMSTTRTRRKVSVGRTAHLLRNMEKPYALNRRSRSEFVTTDTELNAIAVEARTGCSRRPVNG